MRNLHWRPLIGVCLLGIFTGVIGDETYHHLGEDRDKELFAAKLRCQRLGEKYSSDNSSALTGNLISVTVLKTDYSPAVHSCIAEIETTGGPAVSYTVENIVTGELYGGSICRNGDDCDKQVSQIISKENTLFRDAVAGKIKPLSR